MTRSYRPDAPKFYGLLAVILLSVAVWHGVDGWVPQERWLARYPEFPEAWYDLGPYEFYAYNRWTGLILGIAALICGAISLHSHRLLKRQGALLDEVASARRNRRP